MEQEKIGKFIAEKRKENGLTQSQMAEEMGITDKAVSKWETGKSLPDVSLFVPLCELLHITLNELLLGEVITEENIREKSNQILLDVIQNWLGHDEFGKNQGSCSDEVILRLQKVQKVYETGTLLKEAVKSISFEVTRGSFVGIMGTSGCGKSTLLKVIASIEKATGGTIEIGNQLIGNLNEKKLATFRKNHLGFIFQEYNLLDTLTLYENIALALTIKQGNKDDIKSKIYAWAKKLEITDILDKFPYEVSGGQRQRCACVRAMVTEPELILADEPTGALDSHSAQQLLEILLLLRKEYQATILMVTHDAVSASYCDRIMFMKDGEIKTSINKGNRRRQEFFTEILDTIAKISGGVSYVS